MSNIELKIEGIILLCDVGEISKIEAKNRLKQTINDYKNLIDCSKRDLKNIINRIHNKGYSL